MDAYLPALGGGLLIGLFAAMLLLLNGRIAGIGGLVAGLARPGERRLADIAFLVGLILGTPLFAAMAGHSPRATSIRGVRQTLTPLPEPDPPKPTLRTGHTIVRASCQQESAHNYRSGFGEATESNASSASLRRRHTHLALLLFEIA